MDDALLVGGVERVGDLAGVAERDRAGARTLRRYALDELHHEVVGADVEERADVGVVQRGDGPRFALEPFTELLSGDLDGDVAPGSRVVRAIDLSHAPGANLRGDLVRTETGAGGQ